jgi:hypothetical protein
MGWTVLYIAFGIVALWLLGEVLLQYKARLRWRLLAFGGFVGVVAGVLLSNVIVIGLGAAAFAVGQTYVTLSFRRGFEAGWAVNAPASLVGRRARPQRGRREATLEVSGLEAADTGHEAYDRDAHDAYDDRAQGHGPGQGGIPYGHDDPDRDDVFTPARPLDPGAAETTAVYEPLPMPDDTGSYGVYGDTGYAHGRQAPAAAAHGADPSYAYDYPGHTQQGYGYDTGGQQYAAYSDPYIGTHTYGGAAYDTGGYDTAAGQGYGQQQGYAQDQYATGTTGGYGGETPAGGVWVPQQRSTDDPYGGELPPEQTYPYQGNGQAQGQGQDYDEQYRF